MSGVFSAAFWQEMMPGVPVFSRYLPDVAVPHVVGKARGVGHEMAQRDRLLGGAQFRLAVGVKAFQHLRGGKIGQQLADRLVQRELALFDELHAGGARDRLGHGGDPEHAVGGHRIVLGQVALAERALINHLAAGRRHRDHAGNFLGLAFLTQNLIDLGFALHGSPPALFLWSGAIFLPACDPASGRRSAPAMSRSRDGRGVGRARGRATQNCNTWRQSAVDEALCR